MSQIYAIILAAGSSSRMGSCKATLPWGEGTTLLSYQIEQWRRVGIHSLVVAGPHNQADLQPHLSAATLVLNPDPHLGKVSSILAGIRALPADWGSVAISAVDQPRPARIYARLVTAPTDQDLISAPIWQERLGHPIVFARAMLPHLLNLQEETQGLRQILRQFPIRRVDCQDAVVLTNLNTPSDYLAHRV